MVGVASSPGSARKETGWPGQITSDLPGNVRLERGAVFKLCLFYDERVRIGSNKGGWGLRISDPASAMIASF